MSLPPRAALAAIALALWTPTYAAIAADATNVSAATDGTEWPSENSISNVVVEPGADGGWLLDFDYTFLGKPLAQFRIELIPESGLDTTQFRGSEKQLYPPQPGRHHISTVLEYPGEGRSVQIVVSLVRRGEPGQATLASARIDKIIQWPSKDEQDLRYATDSIGNGSQESLREARMILERLLAKNPNNALAYVELARIAMKSNWGPQGLHHAETLLDSALKISPESADAKILLGYVYTHQRRFSEAEKLFTSAARSNTTNVWLWTNWGEMFDMQGKNDQAIVKYREAIARPATGTGLSYGARQNAYIFLLRHLEARKDLDGMEALYKQRIGDYGPSSCYSAEYARFKLYTRGDTQAAIDLARGALDLNCDDAPSREILGLASYVQWAKGGPASAEALNQARVFLPPGAMTLYLLAGSEHTAVAAEKLIEAGERIDDLDDDHMTALGHALQNNKLDAVERLVRLGAHPEIPVSYAEIPAALLPVMDRNVDAIRLMQGLGVDYSKIKYQGVSAIDYAKQSNDDELLRMLQPKELAL